MPISTPAKIKVPFAESGLRDPIPAASDNSTGRAGYDEGFPPVTMIPKTAGGIPPFGQDVNGILYEITQGLQYTQAGNSFVYDSAFATAIGGYNQGALLLRADLSGFWISTENNNTTNPDAGGAGWAPGPTIGVAAVTMTNANVKLTAVQYGKPIIVITGALTSSLNLIFPNISGQWIVINNTTGSFSITCKTAAGTGVAITSGTTSIVGDGTNIYLQNSASSVIESPFNLTAEPNGSNGLLITLQPGGWYFRNPALSTGGFTFVSTASPLTLTLSSGSTLGGVNAVQLQGLVRVINDAGTLRLSAENIAGGMDASETGVVSTTAEGGAGGADSATVIYSGVAVTNKAYRVAGEFRVTNATAGTWNTTPSLVQGASGKALGAVQSLGYGQTWQSLTGSRAFGTTYYNTTGRPIQVAVYGSGAQSQNFTLSVAGVNVGTAGIGGSNVGWMGSVSAVVPPGASYVATASGATLGYWSELR